MLFHEALHGQTGIPEADARAVHVMHNRNPVVHVRGTFPHEATTQIERTYTRQELLAEAELLGRSPRAHHGVVLRVDTIRLDKVGFDRFRFGEIEIGWERGGWREIWV